MNPILIIVFIAAQYPVTNHYQPGDLLNSFPSFHHHFARRVPSSIPWLAHQHPQNGTAHDEHRNISNRQYIQYSILMSILSIIKFLPMLLILLPLQYPQN